MIINIINKSIIIMHTFYSGPNVSATGSTRRRLCASSPGLRSIGMVMALACVSAGSGARENAACASGAGRGPVIAKGSVWSCV